MLTIKSFCINKVFDVFLTFDNSKKQKLFILDLLKKVIITKKTKVKLLNKYVNPIKWRNIFIEDKLTNKNKKPKDKEKYKFLWIANSFSVNLFRYLWIELDALIQSVIINEIFINKFKLPFSWNLII